VIRPWSRRRTRASSSLSLIKTALFPRICLGRASSSRELQRPADVARSATCDPDGQVVHIEGLEDVMRPLAQQSTAFPHAVGGHQNHLGFRRKTRVSSRDGPRPARHPDVGDNRW